MNIIKSFESAFDKKKSKGWDKIYVLVDIHDTIFKGNCGVGEEKFEWLPGAEKALRKLSSRKDICLILWSATHKDMLSKYWFKLFSHDIVFRYINSNPEVQDTDLYCSDKIYFNVGIDDKFGFEPEKDWDKISYFLENIQEL